MARRKRGRLLEIGCCSECYWHAEAHGRDDTDTCEAMPLPRELKTDPYKAIPRWCPLPRAED